VVDLCRGAGGVYGHSCRLGICPLDLDRDSLISVLCVFLCCLSGFFLLLDTGPGPIGPFRLPVSLVVSTMFILW
jgi:hypothetical protein